MVRIYAQEVTSPSTTYANLLGLVKKEHAPLFYNIFDENVITIETRSHNET